MWEAIKEICNGANYLVVISACVGVTLAVIFTVVLLIKHGYIRVQTKSLKIGSESEKERIVLQQQCKQAYEYIMALKNKVLLEVAEPKFGGYLARNILELCYDRVVEWIMFNHISDSDAYVHVKQMEIQSVVYRAGISKEFRNSQFKERINCWVAELIKMLLEIRKVYSK